MFTTRTAENRETRLSPHRGRGGGGVVSDPPDVPAAGLGRRAPGPGAPPTHAHSLAAGAPETYRQVTGSTGGRRPTATSRSTADGPRPAAPILMISAPEGAPTHYVTTASRPLTSANRRPIPAGHAPPRLQSRAPPARPRAGHAHSRTPGARGGEGTRGIGLSPRRTAESRTTPRPPCAPFFRIPSPTSDSRLIPERLRPCPYIFTEPARARYRASPQSAARYFWSQTAKLLLLSLAR